MPIIRISSGLRACSSCSTISASCALNPLMPTLTTEVFLNLHWDMSKLFFFFSLRFSTDPRRHQGSHPGMAHGGHSHGILL